MVIRKASLYLEFFFAFFFHRSSALNTTYFWIGSSTGLLIINLANFELEGFLSYRGMIVKYLNTL